MGARVSQQAGGNGRAGRPEWRLGRNQGAGNTKAASRMSAAPRPLKIVLQFAGRGQ